tara:strand:- start:416 stop:817 length:402 start_codon:yes stop_codon:yes gene_type:complete
MDHFYIPGAKDTSSPSLRAFRTAQAAQVVSGNVILLYSFQNASIFTISLTEFEYVEVFTKYPCLLLQPPGSPQKRAWATKGTSFESLDTTNAKEVGRVRGKQPLMGTTIVFKCIVELTFSLYLSLYGNTDYSK